MITWYLSGLYIPLLIHTNEKDSDSDVGDDFDEVEDEYYEDEEDSAEEQELNNCEFLLLFSSCV